MAPKEGCSTGKMFPLPFVHPPPEMSIEEGHPWARIRTSVVVLHAVQRAAAGRSILDFKKFRFLFVPQMSPESHTPDKEVMTNFTLTRFNHTCNSQHLPQINLFGLRWPEPTSSVQSQQIPTSFDNSQKILTIDQCRQILTKVPKRLSVRFPTGGVLDKCVWKANSGYRVGVLVGDMVRVGVGNGVMVTLNMPQIGGIPV